MPQIVTTQELDLFAVCTLDLPERRNPLSLAMREALVAALDRLRSKDNIRAVVITGAGSAFCSGLDLQALAEQPRLSHEEHLADAKSTHDFFEYICAYPKPTIAAVNGPAVAGGCGLSVVCDITVAGKSAFFALTEVKVGFVPAMVAQYIERLIGPKRARDLLLTGRKVSASEAKAIGLVNDVVDDAALKSCVEELALQIARNSPVAVKMTKALLHHSRCIPLEEALALAVKVSAEARSTADFREGVTAFLEKRPPKWQ